MVKLGAYAIACRCSWQWYSSLFYWPFESVVGVTGSLFHLGYLILPSSGFPKYPFIDHPERKDEHVNELHADCLSIYNYQQTICLVLIIFIF